MSRPLSSLALRLLSAAVFIPLFIVVLRLGGWPYLAFVEGVILLGSLEFYRMTEALGARPHVLAGTLVSGGLAGLFYLGRAEYAGALVTGFLLLVLMLELRRGSPAGTLANMGATVLGVLYVGWLGSYLGLLRSFPERHGQLSEVGARVVFFTFFLTWMGDTGAFFIGRAFGRHKLLPSVSPGKSVEGFFGGIAGALLAAWVGQRWVLPQAPLGDALLLGLLAGLLGPLGDLVESLFKRESGLKDSAHLIPGHGGVLDRFDSLLFVAPVFYYYLRHVVFSR